MNLMSRKHRELGATLVPSKGPTGTLYVLQNGRDRKGYDYYVRTPWGNMKLDHQSIGAALLFRQAVVNRSLRPRRHWNNGVLLLLVITLLFALI